MHFCKGNTPSILIAVAQRRAPECRDDIRTEGSPTEYTESQAFFPVVRIWSPPPPPMHATQRRAPQSAGTIFELRTHPQSIKSARLSFQSSVLGPPTTSSPREWCSSPLWFQGGRHTRLRGRGWGGPNSNEEHSWYSMRTILYL